MASQSNPSFSNGLVPKDVATHQLAIDNLIRRELRVSNPNDAKEVAAALLSRYKERPQAVSISREAEGVPFLLAPAAPAPVAPAATSSSTELQQAMGNVERDLTELTTNAILKDITPELQGWAIAIRSAIREGVNAARFALDRMQRDKTFGIRRTLGDYARLARLVGALTPSVNAYYRKLAQSLDEVSAVLLVMMGEALANVGFGSSRFLLQVPFSELQSRRDAVVYALRNLVGSTQTAYEPSEWHRGLNAYRLLYRELERQGQGDLRALMQENELVRIMDDVIHRTDHGNVEGLRAVGATAQLDLERLRRFILITQSINSTGNSPLKSPEFVTFLDALLLFIEAFDTSGGFRLLRIARPTILTYGIYGNANADSDTENDLVELTFERNRLASEVDCFLQCGCEPQRIQAQVLLDKLLYDVDRAIDLYAVGTGDKNITSNSQSSQAERRAGAYGYLVEQAINWLKKKGITPAANTATLKDVLESIRDILLPTASDSLMHEELCIQKTAEERWVNLIRTLAPGCFQVVADDDSGILDQIRVVIDAALEGIDGDLSTDCPSLDVQVPEHEATSQDVIYRAIQIDVGKQLAETEDDVFTEANIKRGQARFQTLSKQVISPSRLLKETVRAAAPRGGIRAPDTFLTREANQQNFAYRPEWQRALFIAGNLPRTQAFQNAFRASPLGRNHWEITIEVPRAELDQNNPVTYKLLYPNLAGTQLAWEDRDDRTIALDPDTTSVTKRHTVDAAGRQFTVDVTFNITDD